MTQRAVLIVEDDANWKSILTEIVTDCGFKPVVVATYQGTLSALARRNFALAVVDISLFEADYADRRSSAGFTRDARQAGR